MTEIEEVLQNRRSWHVHQSHVLDGLAMLPSGCVHTCVTSIPYWGLRSYSTEPQVWGGSSACQHIWGPMQRGKRSDLLPADQTTSSGRLGTYDVSNAGALNGGNYCADCGAWRGELGLESDPALFVEHIVQIFREVFRVLHPSATLWLNCGDSYVAGPTGHQDISAANGKAAQMFAKGGRYRVDNMRKDTGRHFGSLPPKSLMMMPARVALALQEDGWLLRSEITWCKRAPMPESCTDRPTSATEKIYLFAKRGSYYYDQEAVRERTSSDSGWAKQRLRGEANWSKSTQHENGRASFTTVTGNEGNNALWQDGGSRNLWNYWLLSPEPYAAAHFATFPTEIPRRAISAGSSERGVCPECLCPWRRVVERGDIERGIPRTPTGRADKPYGKVPGSNTRGMPFREVIGEGWLPGCTHDLPPIPALVLDIFNGSGTSGVVAKRLGRRYLGFDLNEEYCCMARERIAGDAPLLEYVEEREREIQTTMELGA